MVFRMPRYTARSLCSQFCCLTLALVLVALPLYGDKPARAPILTPFGAEPLPLDIGLQLPSSAAFQLPPLLTSGRLALASVPSLALGAVLYSDARISLTSPDFDPRGMSRGPSGRSPPWS